jgi:hypothetical protein
MKIMSNIKKAYDKFIENITNANKKSFGKEPLDCCDLNQESNKEKYKK